jgi:DNA-binding transcriptional ArsR family regulator
MLSLQALGAPIRRKIVETLARRRLSSGMIARQFGISAAAASQHLAILREAGLVRVTVQAHRRIYELNPEGIAEIAAWVEELRQCHVRGHTAD